MLNLTQHVATPEQAAEGVVEPNDKRAVQALLTFNTLPTIGEIYERAQQLAALAAKEGAVEVLIGGAPFLMRPLEEALEDACIDAYYAFSMRESTEEHDTNGVLIKRTVFHHMGFIPA